MSAPDDWTPVPRGIVYISPVPPEDGGGLDIGCDCGAITQLIIDGIEQMTGPLEMAFTCHGCQSVHWFKAGPEAAS